MAVVRSLLRGRRPTTTNELRSDVRLFGTSRFALKKETKWSNDEPVTDVASRKKVAAIIKKLNWESLNLYGPVLEPAGKRKKFLAKKRVDVERTYAASAVFRIREAGFKDCDTITPSSDTRVKARMVVNRDALSELNRKADAASNSGDVDPDGESSVVVQRGGISRTTGAVHADPPILNPETSRLLEAFNALPLLNETNENVSLDAQWLEMLASKSSSVSAILQQTMSVESLLALERWRTKMVNLLGEDNFRKYQQEMFRVGSCLHRCIEDFLSEKPLAELEIDESIKGHWKSLQPVLAKISGVHLLETRVQHPVLQYRGMLDGVVNYKGTNVLIEWKTSQRPKPNLRDTYDNPLQAAAYIGALNHSGDLEFQLAEAAIVVAYPCGSPAHVHFLNKDLCRLYWNQWLIRFAKFLTISS